MSKKLDISNKIQNNTKMYEELLESDDEFPLEYNDLPCTPAYMNDKRFDMIEFKWIKDPNTYNFNVAPQPTSKTRSSFSETSSLYEITECESTDSNINVNQAQVIQGGVLNQHDLFCLKSIEGLTDDSTLLWFIKFLVHKDIQSSYKFLKSCLVSNSLFNGKYNCSTLLKDSRHNMYKIVIKV